MLPANQFAYGLMERASLLPPRHWARQQDGGAVSCAVDGFRLCLSKGSGILIQDEAGWPLVVISQPALDQIALRRIEAQIALVSAAAAFAQKPGLN
jgi:hypothetical protein